MQVDRRRASREFATYVEAYDPANPRIALKIAHTYRVAELCDEIARAEGLDADLAWICGLLHDIGRFEQVRRFDTFNDAASVRHAQLSAEILFDTQDPRGLQIRRYVPDPSHDDLIRTAIATHSDYQLPTNMDSETRAYCDLLRDADKIDIIRVNCLCPIEDIYGVSVDAMDRSKLSPAVVQTFFEHRTIPRNIRAFPADILVSHICFAWELVYPSSRRIILEQGYLKQMLNRRFSDTTTQETFSLLAAHLQSEFMKS